MREKPWSVTGEQAFDLVSLCRYFSELSPQPMVVVEGTTHIVRHLNAAFARLAGKRAEELTGRPFAEAVPEGEKNGCLPLLDRVYRTGTPEMLVEQEHSQTPPVYWSYSVWAILGVDERPVGVIIQVTDATEMAIFRSQAVAMNEQLLLGATRQHELTETAERANQLKDESLATLSHEIAERKAAEESIRFQAHLLDTVEQSVIATNLDGIVIYWNQFAQKLYGWSAQEAIGRHIMELTTPEVMTEQALKIMSHLRQGESWAGEFNVQRRDGTTFPAQIINSPVNDDNGTLVGIVGVSINISERKRQEDSLIELTRQLELQSNVFNTTLSSITDFAYIFDREGRFIYANQSLLDLWGLKLDEVVNKNFFDLQYPDDLALRLQQQIQQVFDTKQALRDETPYTSPTGAEGFYEYIFTPVKASDGTVEVVAGSTRDYTERKRAEAELMKLNEQLEQRVAARTCELTEINSSLQSEISERRRAERERASILRRLVMAEEAERGRIARDMHDQFGQQLTVLKLKLDALKEDCGEHDNLCEQVEILQAIARQLDADVDHMVWEMRPTALDDLGLQAALSSYVRSWSQHFGVPVELHTSGMDRGRLTPEIETTLYRIAQEALNNVAKHSQAGRVAVMLERRAGQVSLIIEDDGVGFHAQQVFDGEGTGLGLIGMRERAALVGGTVEFESQPSSGATVAARIPCAETGPLSGEGAEAEARP